MEDKQVRLQSEGNSDFSATPELLANERCLKNYIADIVKKITQGITLQLKGSKQPVISGSILEFGAGTGALAAEYFNQNKIKPDCIEIDKAQVQIIKNRGFNCFNSMNDLSKKYDAIYSSNVLEHIEDDLKTLKELHECLNHDGRIIIYVPAFMCLWSKLDELVGHYRRYSKQELSQKVSLAGFNILSCYYVDSVGFFAWFYLRLKGYKAGNSETPDGSLKFFDRFLYPISQALDFLGCRYLFGKNLLLIAEKSNEKSRD